MDNPLDSGAPASSVRDLLTVPFRDPVGGLSDRTNQGIKFGHFEEPGSEIV